MLKFTDNIEKKAENIKAIVMDIDGVLTDGRFGYQGYNEEIKFFHARDGHALKLAKRAGFLVGAISGRSSDANKRRAVDLNFDFLYEDSKNKINTFEKFLEKFTLRAEECLYIGDDMIDAPIMKIAGVSATVSDAPEYMLQVCDIKTEAPGGHGAVREIVEWLLKIQNKWDDVTKKYFL